MTTRLLGFGASTMQGVGDSRGGFLGRLAALLAAAGTAVECCNHGIGGNSTRDMLARLGKAQALLPARTVVLLGCNDLPRANDRNLAARADLPTYRRNLAAIFDGLAGPGALFVSSFAVCQRRTGVAPADLAAYMAAALELAAARGWRTWDLHRESLAWGDRHWAPDGLHYADGGHELIAARVQELLAI